MGIFREVLNLPSLRTGFNFCMISCYGFRSSAELGYAEVCKGLLCLFWANFRNFAVFLTSFDLFVTSSNRVFTA